MRCSLLKGALMLKKFYNILFIISNKITATLSEDTKEMILNFAQLEIELTTVGLPVNQLGNDPRIAAIYLDHLNEVRDYFKKENLPENSIIRLNYDKLTQALNDISFLKQVSTEFVKYANQAVIKDIQVKGISQPVQGQSVWNWFDSFKKTPAYVTYYDNWIFGVQNGPDRLAIFKNTYERTMVAIERVKNNYIRSIKLVCERLIENQKNINTIFFKPNGNLQFSRLTKINCTGSDTHNGGLQVLILEMEVSNGPNPQNRTLVYKPRDVEVDSMICGEYDPNLKEIYPLYYQSLAGDTKPLFVLLNEKIETYNNANQNDKLEPLTTYKFLPVNYGSRHGPVSDVYGFVEYLSHDAQDFTIINEIQDRDKIDKFYNAIGSLMATTVLFSIADVHFENLLVHNYKPYLIDLEVSLNSSCPSLFDIGFIMHDNRAVNPNHNPRSFCALDSKTMKKNRLVTNGGNAISPAPYKQKIIDSFEKMMDIIKDAQGNLFFLEWFRRMNHVITRHVPISTGMLTGVRNKPFLAANCEKKPVVDMNIEVSDNYQDIEKLAYKNWWDINTKEIRRVNAFIMLPDNEKLEYWRDNLTGMKMPIFFPLKKDYLLREFDKLDIPLFYHRLYTLTIPFDEAQDLRNSEGTKVEINGDEFVNPPSNTDQLQNYTELMVSTNYFSLPDKKSPSRGFVIENQLDPLLTPATLQRRKTEFSTQIRNYFP